MEGLFVMALTNCMAQICGWEIEGPPQFGAARARSLERDFVIAARRCGRRSEGCSASIVAQFANSNQGAGCQTGKDACFASVWREPGDAQQLRCVR